MLHFDGFEPDALLGEHRLLLTAELLAQWRALFPEDSTGNVAPRGMAAILSSRAYCAVVAPRPPGNVHGAQRFEIRRMPSVGETVLTRISCASKRLKDGRRWVQFRMVGMVASGDGTPCFEGLMTVLWAA